jgi:aminopeptidase N
MTKKVARLYEQFQPEHYDLSLKLDRKAMTFSGSLVIDGKKTGRPSQRITFHQKELKITSARIVKHDKKGDKALKIGRINNQNSFDEVRLHADEMVYPGNYTVTMEFEGKITKPMNGIYPCFFTHDGQDKKLIATQFESHHAREAFPCIDEPEAKATFDLTLETPAGETVIANTPVKTQKTKGKNLLTSFETTPKMSSYLLAFVTGELDYKESKTKDGVTVRAYATPDNVGLTQHGLDTAVKILEFFDDYFGVPYPLKKLDMVALPDFNVGAMENWGLMTFRETAMLADPESGSIESKQMVALVVAHEISHQWFGDLVTMKWWDDLWLNESFANLMEYVAVDAIYPEWHIWEQFVSHETASAKRRDSLTDVQPIKCQVNHPDEINTIFDPSIVYAKGGTVLHMLMHHIGEADFRRGMKLYFDKHRYGNTQAGDLWTALGQASGQDIAGFMNDWLERPGYPLITVDWQPGATAVKLDQQRFLSDPAAKPSTDQPWQVPLAANHPLGEPLLTAKTGQTTLKAKIDTPLVFNHDGHSYFLPRYNNPDHLLHIVKAIETSRIDTIDRLLLLDNYTMLQRGGFSTTVELLELLRGYTRESSESVWGAMSIAIGEVRRLIEANETSELKLDAMVQQLVSTTVKRLGWDDRPDDDAQTLRLRGLAYSLAAGAKTKSVLDEGLKHFASFTKPADLPASTRTVVYYIGARYGTDADFQKLLDLYHATRNADEREEIAGAMTGTKEPKRYQQLFKLLKTDAVRRQDFFHWYIWLLRNRHTRQDMWDWLVGEWDWLEQQFGSDKNLSYFARYPGSVFSRPKELKQFTDFFESKKSIVSMGRDISLAEAEIASRIAWRQRNEAAVKAWLKQQR